MIQAGAQEGIYEVNDSALDLMWSSDGANASTPFSLDISAVVIGSFVCHTEG